MVHMILLKNPLETYSNVCMYGHSPKDMNDFMTSSTKTLELTWIPVNRESK